MSWPVNVHARHIICTHKTILCRSQLYSQPVIERCVCWLGYTNYGGDFKFCSHQWSFNFVPSVRESAQPRLYYFKFPAVFCLSTVSSTAAILLIETAEKKSKQAHLLLSQSALLLGTHRINWHNVHSNGTNGSRFMSVVSWFEWGGFDVNGGVGLYPLIPHSGGSRGGGGVPYEAHEWVDIWVIKTISLISCCNCCFRRWHALFFSSAIPCLRHFSSSFHRIFLLKRSGQMWIFQWHYPKHVQLYWLYSFVSAC